MQDVEDDLLLFLEGGLRCEQAAEDLAARTGRPVLAHACDVTDEDAVAGLVDRVLSGHGRLDVLVTSAGMQARGTIDELSAASLRVVSSCLEWVSHGWPLP